jgi:hypothetical protein
MVIWKTIGVAIRHKCLYIKKIGGRLFNAFCDDCGDIPVARINETTGKVEEVVNTRGRAYAARNRLKHRKRKEA